MISAKMEKIPAKRPGSSLRRKNPMVISHKEDKALLLAMDERLKKILSP